MTCGTCGNPFTVGPAPDLCHECGRALRVAEMLKFGMRPDRVSSPRPSDRESRPRRGRFSRLLSLRARLAAARAVVGRVLGLVKL